MAAHTIAKIRVSNKIKLIKMIFLSEISMFGSVRSVYITKISLDKRTETTALQLSDPPPFKRACF